MLPAPYWRANKPFNVPDAAGLRGCGKRNGMSFAISAACPPDPVNIVGGVIWKIVVDHQRDVRDIDTPRSDICCNEYAVRALLKSFERRAALPQRPVGVYFRCTEIRCTQCTHDLFGTIFRARENKHLSLTFAKE